MVLTHEQTMIFAVASQDVPPWGAPTRGRFGTKAVPRHRTPRGRVATLREKSYDSASMSTANSFSDFLADFRATIVSATARLRAMPEEQSRRRTSDDDWAPIEILGHLIDSAANNHQRFVRGQFTDDLVFPGYEQNQWVSSQKYRDESWSDVIQLWSAYNLHLAHAASVIPEGVLTKPRTPHTLDQIAFNLVDKNDPATLEYLIRDYVDHLRHHLNQIFS
jgi:DinB family protein